MSTKKVYLIVRLELESEKEITPDVIQEVVQELDYCFIPGTKDVNFNAMKTEIISHSIELPSLL